MQQQLNEKDYELETHENEIKNYKKEIESHKRGAFEQYLEQKKSLDDLKSSVEKERCLPQLLTDPAIMKQRFDKNMQNYSPGQPGYLDIVQLFSAKVAMDTGARIPWGCLLHIFFLPRAQNVLYQQLI